MAALPKYFYFRVKPINKGTGVRIEEANDADVVEVVRCKDCINRTKSGMCIQWSRYEKIVNTSDYAFCSWGVKRNG